MKDVTSLNRADTLRDAEAPTLLPESGKSSSPGAVDVGTATISDDGFEARYRQKSLLGQGGMGEVRLANDARVGRDVAMKVIRPGVGSRSDARARFLREARVQGQLEHPAIVPVYDLGVTPEGEVYFTMKRIRGISLEEVIEGLRTGNREIVERFSLRKLLTAFSSVCIALDFAHERGVLHRDLKPGNIMLGAFGEVYILDWGLAKVAGAPDPISLAPAVLDADGAPTKETRDGEILGTPGYMPPEQIRGQISALDRRADVYALGSILFEVLALDPLHPRHSIAGILGSTLAGANARASERAPGLALPPELDAVCVKATAVSPDDRFATARELHDAIERFLDGDRDVARRRELASQHAEDAARNADAALRPDAQASDAQDARRGALREVGRALALDPSNVAAVRTLVRLLVEPPKELPAAARAEMERAEQQQNRLVEWLGGLAYLSWLFYIPFLLWMGVRDWTWIVVSGALMTLASMLSFRAAMKGRITFASQLSVMAVATLGLVAVSRLVGPLILIPTLVLGHLVVFALTPRRRERWIFVGVGSLGILLPVFLEAVGVFPMSYAFDASGMLVLPQIVSLPAMPTLVALLFLTMAMILITTSFVGRMKESLADAEKRLQLQSWQLRQLVPEGALEGVSIGPEMGWTRFHAQHCPIEALARRP